MKKLYPSIFIIFIMWSESMAGGGWTQPKNRGYFKFSQGAIIANQYFTPSGDLIDITTTGLYTTAAYIEYGITDRITAIGYVPFFVRSTLNRVEVVDSNGAFIEEKEGDELNALGDINLTAKYGLMQGGPIVMSASLTLGIPMGNESGGETMLLQSGDGEFNQMLTLEVSQGLASGFYWSVLAGFNNRTNNFSDEFRYGGEIGYSTGKFIPILKVYGIASLMNGNEAIIPNNGVFGNNIEYLSITPEVNYQLSDNFGVSFSAGFAAFGKRILANPNYIGGIYFNL